MLEVQKPKIPSKYRYFVNGEWIEEDDMTEPARQRILCFYLEEIIRFLFRFERCFVGGNLLVYPVGHYDQRVGPDVIVVKGVSLSKEEINQLGSWVIEPPHRPVPNVVFEISSTSTWTYDVQTEHKPTNYGALGIPEYFAYDPIDLWINFDTPLKGWRTKNGQTTEIQPNEDGWLWSEQLNSWLVADEEYLRLYDANKKLCVTELEHERQAREEAEFIAKYERQAHEEAEQAKLEAERQAEQERQAREEETRQKLEAERVAEQERLARQELERQIAELQAKLKAQEGQ
jgi:Uma2 family endonuclease